MNWFEDIKKTYFANPTAARDYRVQLRGNRSVLLFGLYLFVLIGVAFATYTMNVTPNSTSVVTAQNQLQTFYQVVMGLLAGMICLITPALTATTIVTERQRHSFDLIFSAPVSPKQYLVGKMIGSYRYTWMLLVLSLPVTASAVVLGGASWSDVLSAYVLLSLHAVALTAIALLMSTVAPKAVSAVVWSYAAVIGFLSLTGSIGGISAFTPHVGREAFFMCAVNPFLVVQAADTYTTVAGFEIPNWILGGLAIMAFTKLVLLAAGAVLSPYGGKEGKSLRIHGLVYTTVLMGWSAYGLAASSTGLSRPEAWRALGVAFSWVMVALVIVMPFMSCFGYENERRYWPNGTFKFRNILDGTPAGALPYIYTLIVASALSVFAGVFFASGEIVQAEFLAYPAFSIGLCTLLWSIGRNASLWAGGLRQARTLMFSAFLVLCVLPVPFLSAIDWNAASTGEGSLWNLWVLYPLVRADQEFRPIQALAYGGVMLLIGLYLAHSTENKLQPKLRRDLIEDERLYARA